MMIVHCLLLLSVTADYCNNRAVAEKPRDATVHFDRYGVYRQLFSFDAYRQLTGPLLHVKVL